MRGFRSRKSLAILLTVSLVLQLTGVMPLYLGYTDAKAEEAYEETDNNIDMETGSARGYLLRGANTSVTYYVGGAGASDSNSGTESVAAFGTLAKAVQEINSTPGNYDIVVLGNTFESKTSTFGDGINEFNVNIKTVTGSAIVMRNGDVPGDFITISNNTNLTLGERDSSYSSVLTIDGGRMHNIEGVNYGTIIKINEGGSLITHERVVIQNIYRWTYSYNNYGGAVYNAGIFDMYGGTIQLCYASYGSGVYNTGTFRLYDGYIKDNGDATYGSGVYNAESGLFEMHGGFITENNGDSYAGGVGNAGVFRLFGGSIDNNYANSNGGVYNGNTGIIYMTGGAINNNRSDYSNAGVFNVGSIYMSGGCISGNTCLYNGGGIYNYGFLNISGGTMENNTAGNGGAIYGTDDSVLIMSGGIIQNNVATNGGAIYTSGTFELSGDSQIPAGLDDKNNIHLLKHLTITDNITYIGNYAIAFGNYSSSVGEQWIKGATGELLSDNISKFYLINNKYRIDNNGYLLFVAQPITYYVGGNNASDTNDGTQDKPLATLDYAFEIGNDATSTFILQSDQILSKPITVKGDITIMSDGLSHKVTRGPGFIDDYMFRVESGSLTLGNKNNIDSSDLLIFDGLEQNRNYGFLNNASSVNIYNGVSIRNYNSYYYNITNEGTLNIYGGSIENNKADEYGIIYNLRNLYMSGGSIRLNIGSGVYNSDTDNRLWDYFPESMPGFYMSGGAIYGNTAETGAAVYNVEGNIVISGDVAFSYEGDLANEIYLKYNSDRITIGGEVNTKDQIIIGRSFCYDGLQILDGEAPLLRGNYNKFKLTMPELFINEQGIAKSYVAAAIYYVNSSGNDSGTGSINDPFATIHKAVQSIGIGRGTIVLQSDITINQSIVVAGDIIIQSDGRERNIYRGDSFIIAEDLDREMARCMFYVSGKLILGGMGGDDSYPNLFLNGNGEGGGASIPAIIYNNSILEVYPGVVIHNNISERYGAGIINEGDFHMYGGSIRDNISGSSAGIHTRRGTFVMDGGTITNNTGSSAGVVVVLGAFTMNGGSITENTSIDGTAGVSGRDSRLSINGGKISGNNGLISGIECLESTLYIGGGHIEENTGMSAGIYGIYGSEIIIKGGNIRNNEGTVVGGIILGLNSLLDFSGGTIGGNLGSISQGIIIEESSRLILSGNAKVEADNKIIIQEWNTENKIMLKGRLTSDVAAIIDIYRMDMESVQMFTQELTVGRKLLESSGGYNFSLEDVSRLVLADSDYAIDTFGIIGTAIKDAWIMPICSEEYSGREKTVNIVVKDGDTVLTNGVHYIVSYVDNVYAGKATILVVGIGGYAGIAKRQFEIYKAVASSILTPIPSEKRFFASEHMTEAELLESITLSHVEVAYRNGTAWLPVEWRLTQGRYNPFGGTYIYTGAVQDDYNIDANGLTLTMRIIVEPFKSYRSETVMIGEDKDKKVSIIYRKDGYNLYSEYLIKEEFFHNEKDKLVIPISTKELIKQLESDGVKNINISLTIPEVIHNSEGPGQYRILLEEELLKAAKAADKNIIITIKDENGVERYSWTFDKEDLRNSSSGSIETELGLNIRDLKELDGSHDLQDNFEDEDENGFVISFDHNGKLPSQASVRIYVGDREGAKPGRRIYLYHYSPDTGKLNTLPGGYGYLVDDEGYITVNILHCSDYVALYEEAAKSLIISLRDQIKVTIKDKVIYTGVKNKLNITRINIVLPMTLELVEMLEDETAQGGTGGVTATYQSTREAVAVVDENGVITAKGRGTTTIITKLTLYNGKEKIVRTVVIVRDR